MKKERDAMKYPKEDLYDKYHPTKGATSEGQWQTVLFGILGVILAIGMFFLYAFYRHLTWLMIGLCVLSVLYAYVELSQLFIRKYWFRGHRRIAVLGAMVLYFIVMAALVSIVCSYFDIFHPTALYVPFFLMPPMYTVLGVLYFVLRGIAE